MSIATSKRIFREHLAWPIESFCQQAGIQSFEFIQAQGGLRIRAAPADCCTIEKAVTVIEAASKALQRMRCFDAKKELAIAQAEDLALRKLAARHAVHAPNGARTNIKTRM